MYKHLFRTTLLAIWILVMLPLWTAKSEYSQVINITWFNADWESWQLIQSFIQKRDDLELYFFKDQENIKHYTIMDRNMWADEVYTWTYNINSIWYYYQRWNNYGFKLWCYSNWCNSFLSWESSSGIVISYEDWSLYMPWKYAMNIRSTAQNWIWWSTNDNNNLWWWSWDTIEFNWNGDKSDRQWPCPKDYYIPSILDWLNILNEWENVQTDFNALKRWYDLLLFRVWVVSYGTHKHVDLGNNGPYQSSSLKSDSSPYYLVYNSNKIYTGATRTSDARAIRCFKIKANESNLVMWTWNIHLNWWMNVVISIDGKKIMTLDNPVKFNDNNDELQFMWRYSTENFMKWTKVTKWDTVESWMNLYARWSGDDENVLYMYDANGWSFSGWQTGIINYYAVSWEVNTDIVEIPIMTWYTFTWWYDELTGWNNIKTEVAANNKFLYAHWQVNQYRIRFDTDWGSEIAPITADYWTWIIAPVNPTKNGYRFIRREPEIPATMPLSGLTVKAIWERNWSSWGGGWWGWSSATPKDEQKATETPKDQTSSWTTVKEPETNTWNKAEIQTWNVVDTSEQTPQDNKQDTQDSTTKTPEWKSTYSPEFQEAYEFAKWNGITTMPTIQKADMNWKLTRIAMAKMLSQYAINVLWKTPDATLNNKFNDVTDKLDLDYDDWVTLAYQLWIMWQNMPWNNFRPDDEVTRAEFATALSRMLYKTSDWIYKSTDKYYTNHMSKLVKEWIITKDDPKMKELRGYVMIMLMRSAK